MTLLAIDDRTRRLLRDRLRVLPADGEAAIGVLRLRALLEELGVHCDDSLNLQDLDAILLASERGTDALVASRLDDSQRHAAYARLVARLVITDMHAPMDAKMEYAERHEPSSTREREEEALVIGLASALLEGRLESAPRPLYDDVPQPEWIDQLGEMIACRSATSRCRVSAGSPSRWTIRSVSGSPKYR